MSKSNLARNSDSEQQISHSVHFPIYFLGVQYNILFQWIIFKCLIPLLWFTFSLLPHQIVLSEIAWAFLLIIQSRNCVMFTNVTKAIVLLCRIKVEYSSTNSSSINHRDNNIFDEFKSKFSYFLQLFRILESFKFFKKKI